MVNSHHTLKNMQKIINTQQTSGAPIDVRRKLNTQIFVALGLIKNGKAMRKPSMVANGEAMKAEAAEQLAVLNWIDFMPEFDAENLKKAIKAFEAETERMKGES